MITLKESIEVRQPVEKVFDYTADFTNIEQWDPGVHSSVKTENGYDLILNSGPFRPRMRYEVIEFQPHSRVVLKGTGDTFSALDTITFEKSGNGTCIDYQADIEFSGPAKHVEWLLAPWLRRVGRKSVQGLKRVLDNFPKDLYRLSLFKSGSGVFHFIADHTILPGLFGFTRQGFAMAGRFWQDDTHSLFGRQVVLTGGTSGIGKAAAFALAQNQARLTIIARNPDKARSTVKEIIAQTGNPRVDFMIADLSIMQDVHRVSRALMEQKRTIDVLINNAGALFNERTETSEGIERTFATDLLGIFILTRNLVSALSRSHEGRIINVSSGGMYTQGIDLDDLENHFKPYEGAKAYARAKRGLVLLTRTWAEQLAHLNISVHAMHPGWVDTPGIRTALPGFHSLTRSVLRSPEQGADTMVWLASVNRSRVGTGLFWLDRRPRETVVFPGTGHSDQERMLLWEKLHEYAAPYLISG
ncbi:MAG: SDR family NAD(P)-dependent oxidoreductase [Desulfobacteraceae bacterium]|nr:MAG: SDR family NAD(P)-dependent oxidoreductase [Desulfobacteraceae bacterium]